MLDDIVQLVDNLWLIIGDLPADIPIQLSITKVIGYI
jgi:hypothetical protein